MARVLTPKVIVQDQKEIKKDMISDAYDITTEIKILRETISQLLEKVTIEDSAEFEEYDSVIRNVKQMDSKV